jgi:hypothetical protein
MSFVDPDGLLVTATLGGLRRGMGLNQAAQIGMMGNIELATGVIGATTATAAGLAGYTCFGSIPAAARTAGGLLKGLRDDAIPPLSAPQPPVSTPPAIIQPGGMSPPAPPPGICPRP